MTNFEKILSMNIDDMEAFLNTFDYDEIMTLFDREFCKNCETIKDETSPFKEYAFCEIEGNKCPHCNGNAIRWWLNQPCDDNEIEEI